MSTNNTLEKLKAEWSKYNSPPTTGTRSSNQPSKPKQFQHHKVEPKPTILKSTFNSECYTCYEPVVFNTLWWNDFKNCYIPLDPNSMLEHRCKKRKQAKIFQTF